MALAPQAVVVGAKVAIKFLEDLVHQPFESQIVKTGNSIDLGNGHIIDFVNAPNLHWPDTIFSYDRATSILYTCDAFGMHYCSESNFDEDLSAISKDYRFYYDCLMAPNARSVLGAMKRMDKLGEITTVANGHGPILRYNVQELLDRYQKWSKAQTKAEKTVAVFYISDYGYSDRLSQAIAKGITKTEVAVEMVDLRSAENNEVHELVSRASGIVLGMPPLNSEDHQEIVANIGTVLAAAKEKQVVGMFESYGDDDEPIDPLLTKFNDVGLKRAFPAIRVKETPNESTYQLCEESGTDLGQLLTRDKMVKQMKSLDRSEEHTF